MRSPACPGTDLILDGEATGVWGRAGAVGLHIFDILWLNGRDVTGLPLEERRDLLRPPGGGTADAEGSLT